WVVGGNRVREALECGDQLGICEHRVRVLENARVARAGGVLADEQLFVQLFAAPQPDIFDVDIAFRIVRVAHFETGEADHGAGKIVNLHRRPHAGPTTSPAAGHGARLDHQLGRLQDGHEVANDLGVGDGDRAAGLNLIAEPLDYRARRIEHVAEAHHGEDGGAARRRQRLQDQLGEPLARAHDVGRAHRLVARHEHEALNARFLGHLGEGQRSERVVLQSSERIHFDQWDVLIGGGVVDYLDAEAADGTGDELAVEHRAEYRYDLGIGKLRRVRLLGPTPLQFLHLHLNLVERD